MNSTIEKWVSSEGNRQHFVSEVEQMLAPYGHVERFQLMVDHSHLKSEISCFVEMETPQQAEAAQDSLNVLLLENRYLFFCVKLRGISSSNLEGRRMARS